MPVCAGVRFKETTADWCACLLCVMHDPRREGGYLACAEWGIRDCELAAGAPHSFQQHPSILAAMRQPS